MKNNKTLDLFFSFLKLGFSAFGGPAMVVYIKELAVEKRKWIDAKTFQEGVALAQAIPGATAMQVAGYVGLKTKGIIGGLLSFIGFGFPAFLFMLILSSIYEKTHTIPQVMSVFTGLQVIVVAIVANAFLSFAKPVIESKGEIAVAVLSFALFLAKFSPFVIIILCFFISQFIFKDKTTQDKKNLKKINFTGIATLIFIVLTVLAFLYFFDKTLFDIALIMMKIDFFAFGGGYASVPLMLHEVVGRLHWLNSKTFMDGIALGQITPGPIVITATFVGYLLKGLIGAIVGTIFVFTPSFVIMTFACEISAKVKDSQIFLRAKKGLLASFSGLLLFALIEFARSLDWSWIKLFMVLLGFFALYKKVNILYVIVATVVLSVIIFK
jgi:chromate transporter